MTTCCCRTTSRRWERCWTGPARHAGSEDVRRLVAIADSAAWWPAILRHPPDGKTEQARLWSALGTGAAACVEGLRGALDVVLARIGWASVHPLGPGDEPTLAAVERLAADRDAAVTARDGAVAALAALHASTSWRITAPLRADARLFGRG